jgi:hypothetical protein
MAPITKRRRVLGPHAHPRLWRLRTRFEGGYVWKRTESLGGRVVCEGTHFFSFFSFVFVSPMCAVGSRHIISRHLDVQWTLLAMGSAVYFFQQGSLLVALLRLSATRYVRDSLPVLIAGACLMRFPLMLPSIRSVVMFSYLSSVWAKTLSSATWVSTVTSFSHRPDVH